MGRTIYLVCYHIDNTNASVWMGADIVLGVNRDAVFLLLDSAHGGYHILRLNGLLCRRVVTVDVNKEV